MTYNPNNIRRPQRIERQTPRHLRDLPFDVEEDPSGLEIAYLCIGVSVLIYFLVRHLL